MADFRPQYRPVRTPLMSMGPSLEEERRRHRAARLIAVASVVVVIAAVLLVWVVGLLGREVVSSERPDGTVQAAAAGAPIQQAGPPAPQTLAEAVDKEGVAGLRLQLPIRREAVTGLGYLPRNEPGVVELRPSGARANNSWIRRTSQRFLSTAPTGGLGWYQLESGAPSMVIVGAAPGAEVYAPIDGKVESITDYELAGATRGVIIQLRPIGDTQTLVVLRNLDGATDLSVGMSVARGLTRIGTVRDMEGALDAPLATYTHDSGSGVDMYVTRSVRATTSLA